MNHSIPEPSTKSLILLTLFSILLAIAILLVAIMPAEFGLDPTGVGKQLGLLKLAESPQTKIQAQIIECPEDKKAAGQSNLWKDTVVIVVPPKDGLEYKFYLRKGDKMEFAWRTDNGKLYFDFHGEPEGDTSGYFKSYKETTDNHSTGSLIAPFTGSHGWYWENKSSRAVIVSLRTRGNYKILGLR